MAILHKHLAKLSAKVMVKATDSCEQHPYNIHNRRVHATKWTRISCFGIKAAEQNEQMSQSILVKKVYHILFCQIR